ncbi:TetR family transcriptional regulator [Streptomyces sp. Ag109_O5-1]|uniref:TetR/AcrR family transcriptional regulator n=1 Tax=Streptomyces sp. Ag109_O5-1 TaxID=1938851 RepID=UPI000FAAA722|nr:TetR family transcriptional regulator [Streptomyces sp. Ag109_O5-1]RPE38541.1 TetR family transcriptional regulator [Streptomyces sp. Ag109_O5-1]
MPLTEAGIYAAALRLIDEDGVEALTMRKLATELDANPMSLYHHVPNREAVLRGVAKTVGSQFRTVTLQDAPWQERIRLLATDFRTLAHRHPKLMAYSFSHQPDFIQSDDPFWSALTAIVAATGVPRSDVSEAAALIVAVVVGVLTAELNGSLHQWANLKPPGLAADGDEPVDVRPADPDQDRMFRLVMDTLIAGLESRLAADRDGQGAGR